MKEIDRGSWHLKRPPVAPSTSEIVFSWDESLGTHVNSLGQRIYQRYSELDEELCSAAWRKVAENAIEAKKG